MKKALLILSILTLTNCTKKTGPDETMIMQGESLRLPPEYVLKAPEEVTTIKTTPESVEVKSQKILLNSETNSQAKDVNLWLMKNAGGQARIKNIKQIIEQDNKAEEKK